MNELQSEYIACPYCGETITVLIDCSVPEQEYIEDCQVCCRLIVFDVRVSESGEVMVAARHEDE